MDESMNVAKIMPCGMVCPLGLSAGVHRNTKLYIDASKRDCIAPRSPTRGSPEMAAIAVRNCCVSPPAMLPDGGTDAGEAASSFVGAPSPEDKERRGAAACRPP